jgi:diguanylate cyclase (GGDEF)-like protein
VLIYRREGQARDRVTVESTSSGACPLVETGPTQQWLLQFMQAFECHPDLAIEAIEDVRTAPLPERVLETLDRLQIRATLVVPIPYSQSIEWECNRQNQLWGLLVAHQCCDPRQWQPAEIEVIESLAEQIAIAIQHGELHEKLANANRELERLAHLDGLTGLANRRCFDDYLALEWRRMQREGQSLSLIMADVDFFKAYNDTYGHPQGDECLKAVARELDRCTKRPADLAARYGGEEFAIVLPNTPLEGALTIARTIQECVKQLDLEHERSEIAASVTLSLGVASCVPQPELSWEGLLQLADKALYRAKKSGRDRVIPMQVTVERSQNFARSASNL